jgi:hypothetical protein
VDVTPATAGHKKLSEVANARTIFLVSVGVTALLYAVPYGQYVAYPLLLLSTLVHELGHGLTAVLMGGDFESFKMWADGSGVAMHSGRYGAVAAAMVSAGGLVGPAVGAAVGLTCARRTLSSRVFLYIIGGGLALSLLLVVRNPFGWVFVGAVAAICLFIAAKANGDIAQIAVMFLSVQLALSVFSRSDYLFTAEAQTANGVMPSDVQQMSNALGGPYWFWGAVCAALSVAVLGVGAFSLLRKNR